MTKDNDVLLNYKIICKNNGIYYLAYTERYINTEFQSLKDKIPVLMVSPDTQNTSTQSQRHLQKKRY